MRKITNFSKFAFGVMLMGAGCLSANAAWETLDFSKLTGDSPVGITQSGITSVEQVQLIISPEFDGTLYVSQAGSQDSHIFTEQNPENLDYGGNVQYNPGLSDGGTFNGNYVLEGGQTYYFIAKYGTYDDITSAIFSKYEELPLPAALPMNEIQSVTDDDGVKYSYTAEESGTLIIYSNQVLTQVTGQTYLYSSATYNDSSKIFPYATSDESGNSDGLYMMYKFSVVAGEVYYFAAEKTMWFGGDTDQFLAEFSDEIYVPGVTVEPAAGQGFDYNKYKDINLIGTAELTLDKVELSYNGTTKDLQVFQGEGSYDYQISGPFNNVLQIRMNDGLMTEILNANADEFSIIITNLSCGGTLLGDNGTYTVTYTVPQPVEYLADDSTWPSQLYTYFAPGNPEGMVTLAFSRPIASVGSAVLFNGSNFPGNEGYKYNFTPSVPVKVDPADNTKVIVDLTGLDLDTMLAEFNEEMAGTIEEGSDDPWTDESLQSSMTLFVQDIISTDNMSVDINGYPVVYKNMPLNKEYYPGDEPPTYMEEMATSTPAADNTEAYTELDNVTISWSSPVKALSDATVLNVNVSLGTSAPVSVSAVIEEGKLLVDLSDIYGENGYEGEVTVSLPGLLVVNDDNEANKAQDFTYLVKIVVETPDDPDPETPTIGGATAMEIVTDNGVEGVSITWDEYAIELNEAVDGGVSVTSSIEGVPVVEKIEVVENALVVTFETPIEGETTLTVNIVEGCVFVGDEGAVNEAQTLTLTISGVASIGIDSELGRVYNLQGVRMKAQNASELPAGLYIIDGKKVVIRK